MPEPRFTVDTHIFRELGELLVGRDSTAIAELIKNSYDADSSKVTLTGHMLGDPRHAKIVISDDGNGMSMEQFVLGFLRIAGRQKEAGSRRSPRFERRYTGEKGIGRLAAHKLARQMRITSIPNRKVHGSNLSAIEVLIDWDVIESGQTLDDTKTNNGILIRPFAVKNGHSHGTWIELSGLRRKWTEGERQHLYLELQDLQPPKALTELSSRAFTSGSLFDQFVVRDASNPDPGFEVNLEGDFSVGESFWDVFLDQPVWLVEIDAFSSESLVQIQISPSRKIREAYAAAKKPEKFQYRIEANSQVPKFQARLIIREGATNALGGAKSFVQRIFGVRVYVEGFRVLPYGESGNDWLRLDADYARRQRAVDLPTEFEGPIDRNTGLSTPPNRQVFGVVTFTQESSAPLRMLVNREGFIADAAFDYVSETVRNGINYYVRHRQSITQPERDLRKIERKVVRARPELDSFSTPEPVQRALAESIASARSTAKEAASLAAKGKFTEAVETIDLASKLLFDGAESAEKLLPEKNLIRILAAIGLQMGAFVHEVRAVHGMAATISSQLREYLESNPHGDRKASSFLGALSRRLSDLTQSLERHASYLTDAISVDARRRRSPQPVRAKFEAALQLVGPQIERRHIQIEIDIPPELKSGNMFGSELTLIFSNLVTNAVKAAGEGGKIRCVAKLTTDSLVVRIDNTGIAVDLDDAEKWFLPFESTTEKPDPILGFGMGMGLPITRGMIESYGGMIGFTKPGKEFSSAIQFSIPLKR